MKKIEVVMDNLALDVFKQSAAELGISEFDVVQVRRSSALLVARQRLYRGQPFTVDLLSRSKVEFAVFDEEVKHVVHVLTTTLHPDSISIFKIDEVVSLDRGSVANDTVRLVRRGATRNGQPLVSHVA